MDRRMFEHTIQDADFPSGVVHVELPDAGHFLQLERPDEITQLLIDHLAAT